MPGRGCGIWMISNKSLVDCVDESVRSLLRTAFDNQRLSKSQGREIFTKTRNGDRKGRSEAVNETSPDLIIWPLWCGKVMALGKIGHPWWDRKQGQVEDSRILILSVIKSHWRAGP